MTELQLTSKPAGRRVASGNRNRTPRRTTPSGRMTAEPFAARMVYPLPQGRGGGGF